MEPWSVGDCGSIGGEREDCFSEGGERERRVSAESLFIVEHAPNDEIQGNKVSRSCLHLLVPLLGFPPLREERQK